MRNSLMIISIVCLLLGSVGARPPTPADHLLGIPLERDGDLNPRIHRELLLGASTEPPDPGALLSSIFHKADQDRDGFLHHKELMAWIGAQIKAHFKKAVQDNLWTFSSLDKNHDGRVSWTEYHHTFLRESGLSAEFIANHSENHRQLPRALKEKILLDKAAWSEAANSEPDALNIDEFLTFRHPEHSHVALLNTVNTVLDNLDDNGDGVLSVDEFANGSSDDRTSRDIPDQARRAERRREFRSYIDLDKDGRVTRQELLVYSDPENPLTAFREARQLMLAADANGDGKLTLAEVLAKKELFQLSKMVDTARSFHDEF